MKKYKTSGGWRWSLDAVIKEIEVERETESSVWINGRRNAKITEWCVYHDTYEKAYDHLIFHAERKLKDKLEDVRKAENTLDSIKRLKK